MLYNVVLEMKHIIVEQYSYDEYLNIYVADSHKNILLEEEENGELLDIYKFIEKYKQKYDINKIEFVLYGMNKEAEMYRWTVLI